VRLSSKYLRVMGDIRLPPRNRRELCSSVMAIVADVSGQPLGPNFKVQEILNHNGENK